jgi:hypothetical protein
MCGFAICGLAHLKNLQFCYGGISREFADLRCADFKNKFSRPPPYFLDHVHARAFAEIKESGNLHKQIQLPVYYNRYLQKALYIRLWQSLFVDKLYILTNSRF